MRIGIDFDNTIICYDKVFTELAKSWKLIEPDYQGSKQEVKARIQSLPDGDLVWQRLQGKAYGEFIAGAEIFAGFKEFIAACHAQQNVTIFIVSHKTEFGHFDEKQISLREQSRWWLREEGFVSSSAFSIPEPNVFFETTREEKIARIKALQCTHFIDDLQEVLYSPLFPTDVQRFLFQPGIKPYSTWEDIQHAIFTN